MSARGKWQGMFTIFRLNWPLYLIATIILVASLLSFGHVSRLDLKLGCALAAAGCLYFLLGSLGVSYLVYDRSDLYRWGWLGRAFKPNSARDVVLSHCGFDEVSLPLQQILPDAAFTVLDHFDEQHMTEPSIYRARQLFPPPPCTREVPYDRFPIEDATVDVVFGILAIHELRAERERSAWFGEARRCLRPGGRIVLVEHTRDLANFFAFGPGFIYFHSRGSWHRCWEQAGLHLHDEFKITPWVRVFVLAGSE